MMRSAILTQITRETDGQTDGIGVAYTRYAVARKKMGNEKHAYFQVGEIKGRKIKLLKHVFALYIYSLPIIFSKIFSLATLAQLRFILHLKMQVCNVLYQPHLYFFLFLVSFYLTASFQNSLKKA